MDDDVRKQAQAILRAIRGAWAGLNGPGSARQRAGRAGLRFSAYTDDGPLSPHVRDVYNATGVRAMARSRRAITADRRIATMPHRVFYSVDLAAWVYRTIEKHRQGTSWPRAWVETYREIGGATSSGEKICPMMAARTLYELGRIKDGGKPFKDHETSELWEKYGKNGTYAILATRLLRENPLLSKTSLWPEIQQAVRCEVGDEPARTDEDGPRLAYQLWHLGLIVDVSV